MFTGKTLADFTNLFLPHNLKKKDKAIMNYFFEIEYKHEWTQVGDTRETFL